MVETKITPRCRCGRALYPIGALSSATVVADRKCRECKTLWRVIARPMGGGAGWRAHRCDLTEVCR